MKSMFKPRPPRPTGHAHGTLIVMLGLSALCLLLNACSTTANLPDGETLYTGTGRIVYTDKGEQLQKASNDSAGVIRSIADAADMVSQVLKGNLSAIAQTGIATNDSLSKKEKARQDKRLAKAAVKALEAAQTEVNAVLEYAPNNSLFGSAYHRMPLPTGLWAYNAYVNKTSGWAKWMYKTFASEPVLISTVNPDTRIKIATNTLKNYGYFQGKVDYAIAKNKSNERKAKIDYQVKAGPVYRLDSIVYRNFPTIADSIIRRNERESYLKKGEAFSVLNLTNEQTRLENLFRNNGYYYYKSNMATFKADTVQRPLHVQLVMEPTNGISRLVNKPWYMGHTYINILRSENDSATEMRTRRWLTTSFSGKRPPLHPIVFLQNIAHRPRMIYRLEDEERTQEMLSSLGVFSRFSVNYQRRDSTATCDTLDLHIDAILDKPFTSDIEMNVTEKNSDRIGPGLSWSLGRKNAFGGAETVNFKVYGSYEWRTHQEGSHSGEDKFLNSYNVGTQLSLDFPRIVFPGITRRTFRFPTATTFSLTADWLNRSGYFNLFSSGIGVTYSWHKKRTSNHELTPFSLTYDKLINSTHGFDSIMQANPALYVSMRDRFVPAMQYTYTYQSSERHRNPLWWQFTVKEAGNITSGIYALAGKRFGEKNKNLFHNPFAQYIKITSELHNTFRLHRQYRLVTRLMGGVVWSFGNSDVAPYSDQFFIGGANSIRAFTIRTIGPGRYYEPRSRYSYMDQTGDIKLEANVEFRFPMFGSLEGATFIDAGNVWLMRSSEQRPGGTFSWNRLADDIALGTGAGLRYNLGFLVLRFDLGIALHDPSQIGRKAGYYNIGKWKDGMALHFAIGYPF